MKSEENNLNHVKDNKNDNFVVIAMMTGIFVFIFKQHNRTSESKDNADMMVIVRMMVFISNNTTTLVKVKTMLT